MPLPNPASGRHPGRTIPSTACAAQPAPLATPRPRLARPAAPARVANDNAAGTAVDDRLLRAALRLWGEDGLAAAQHAHRRAEHHFFAGERVASRWWMAVTRVLDAMLAAEFAVSAEAASPRAVVS